MYLPLARLIHLQVAARQRLFAATAEFLGEPQQNPDRPVPFIIGVAGSVAVGKSTTARVLQALLARWGHHPRVDLVTTDGFLYPNRELNRRNLMHRKGFPESYNRRALMRFVTAVKSGSDEVWAPVYSHLLYDIVPGEKQIVRHPDILIRGSQRAADRPGADGLGPLRLLGVRRRPHRGHRTVVHLPVPDDAVDGVRRPGVTLPPLLDADRRAGRVRRTRHLAFHQPAQPDREHPAHQAARDPGAAQDADHAINRLRLRKL